jgi:hypothetical protein
MPALCALCLLSLALVPACTKKPKEAGGQPAPAKTQTAAVAKTPGGAPAAKSDGFHEPILASLSKAGFKVGVFEQTAARPYQAKACVQGEVEGLDVLLCTFDNEQRARAEERGFQQFFGTATTGAARQRGLTTLAVADRKNVDLKGKQINKLLQAFSTPGT